MVLDDAPADREAYAEAGALPAGQLLEEVEDPRGVALGEALAVVADPQFAVPGVVAGSDATIDPDDERYVRAAILDGILDQVAEELAQLPAVGANGRDVPDFDDGPRASDSEEGSVTDHLVH